MLFCYHTSILDVASLFGLFNNKKVLVAKSSSTIKFFCIGFYFDSNKDNFRLCGLTCYLSIDMKFGKI